MKAILMNPPYSAEWVQQSDERFDAYGLAPKTKADFAFLLHGYSKLDDNGKMAIVLPHGVLFRGAAEGKIRRRLLEEGAIDAIIGLPSNLFFGTNIPVALIVLTKNRKENDVLFIDASNEFEKGKNQNFLLDEHQSKIFEAYSKRENIDKYAYVASFDEIKENDFNLNIPRYVDTFEEEEPIDIGQTAMELMDINRKIRESEAGLLTMLEELTGDEKAMEDINLFKEMLIESIGNGENQTKLF